jgi:competence protein ComFC
MKIIKDFFHLFYPKICVGCDLKLVENELVICTLCRDDLPLTNIENFKKNKIVNAFYGRVNIEKAFSLLFFRKKGITKKLIHDLKYKGNQEIGVFFGNWLGELLKENEEFKNIDFIVPVPLHNLKLKKRGYNQVTKFGERLSFYLETPLITDQLIRVSSTKTQTFKARFERFNNNDTKFLIKNPTFFNNANVLLIDDVITSGATLEACANGFSKSENCKISILTMAYTE